MTIYVYDYMCINLLQAPSRNWTEITQPMQSGKILSGPPLHPPSIHSQTPPPIWPTNAILPLLLTSGPFGSKSADTKLNSHLDSHSDMLLSIFPLPLYFLPDLSVKTPVYLPKCLHLKTTSACQVLTVAMKQGLLKHATLIWSLLGVRNKALSDC